MSYYTRMHTKQKQTSITKLDKTEKKSVNSRLYFDTCDVLTYFVDELLPIDNFPHFD